MLPLDTLDWAQIRAWYDNRAKVHARAKRLLSRGDKTRLAELVLAVSEPAGNWLVRAQMRRGRREYGRAH